MAGLRGRTGSYKKILKSGLPSEAAIQAAAFQWIKLHPKLKRIIFHIPNESPRSAMYGKHLRDQGMLAGVWDIFIMLGAHGYNGAWIEVKSAEGVLSSAQKIFGEEAEQQGYYTVVLREVDDIIEHIKWYCNVK